MTSADQLVFAFFCLFVIFLLSTCVQSIPRIKLKNEGSWDADIYSLPSTVQTRVITNSEHFISIHIYRNHEDAPISLFIRCLFLDVVWIISFMAFNNMMCLSYNKEENGRATDRYEKTMKKRALSLSPPSIVLMCMCRRNWSSVIRTKEAFLSLFISLLFACSCALLCTDCVVCIVTRHNWL